MAQNTILQITQDSIGFMWFATPNGLCRYDSREFKTYRNNPSQGGSLSSHYVRSVFCYSKGILWVGTQNGLNQYNSVTDSFALFANDSAGTNGLSNKSIRSFAEDQQKNICVGTANGLNRISWKNGQKQITRYLVSEKSGVEDQTIVHSLHTDRTGTLWAATSKGLAKIQSGGSKIELIRNKLVDKRITAVHSDHSGNI